MFLQVNGGPVKLSAPHETWPKSLAPLIGTASITAEHDDVGMRLSSLLGWDAPLPLPLVLAHWERIIDFTAKLKALEEGPISVDVCQRIKHTTMKIYDHLDRYIGLKQLDRPLPEPGVWTGTEFVSVHRVAWDAPEVDTAGVLMPIPSSLRLRECLAKAMKIKPAFTAEDYLQVLVAICDNGELAKVDTVELLLLHLAKQPRGWLVAHGSKLRAPDIERTAYWPLEELAYADSTKVLKTLRGIDAPVKLISERIPCDIAAKLGAKSLSHLLQEEFSELIGVEYGQEEKLTSRIANILHNYSHEDLLKELVQNAEDAGATEFCLLLDKKTHASNLLFNPMMAQFQGPSLLIYNNRTLLEHDIANISRLGDSHKLESYQKIGRFGVGLNTAYHYADLLQFLSGETLLILDPHAKHVTGASEKKPGRRYKFTGRLFDSFQDQLSPFQSVINDHPSSFFLTDPHQPFEGTLLRLPLRNKDAASRLSKNHWIGEWQGFKKIEEMLDHFKNEALSCLLFLRHLQQVAIYVRETDGRVRLHSMAKRTAPALSVPKLLESATQQFTEVLRYR
jgi:sacsin